MFLWILKQVILSLVIIILIHYLYLFFKTNLTIPKIKDLVNRPEQKYKEMYKYIEKESPPTPKNAMKGELKKYLKMLEKKDEPTPAATTNNNIFNNNFQTF